MYHVDKKHKPKLGYKSIIIFLIVFLIICAILATLLWFFIFKNSTSTSANFIKAGSDKIVISGPTVKVHTNALFSISLPEAWVSNGRYNPFSNQEYYEFQDKTPKNDNRWFRVYVDVFPSDYPLKQVTAISAVGDKLDVGIMSDECQNFTKGAVNSNVSTIWNGLKFTCSLNPLNRDSGSLNKNGGYGVRVTGLSGQSHNYFFVYKDLNSHPRFDNMADILKSFVAK
jgi:hypothetical protein